MSTQVYLVPGFFGFASLGSLNYFRRVNEALSGSLRRRGIDAEIVEVSTKPTSSIRRRALALLEEVRQAGGLEQDHLHFVGHSTGGLDVRLLLTPRVTLDVDVDEQAVAERTRCAVTLGTPHFGTPLANFFTGFQGRNLLYLLTALAASGPGRIGVWGISRALTWIARFDDLVGQRDTLLDSIADRVLEGLTYDKQHALYEFLRSVASDQGAMVQLTPEATDLFNAAVADCDHVDYVSFLTAAPRPRVRRVGPDVYALATAIVFALAYAVTRREHRHYPYPPQSEDLCRELSDQLGFLVDPNTNDGIVPTLSQVWGRIGGVALGDHLDVVGQFPHVVEGKKYPGWLSSGASFDDERFAKLWDDIAGVIAEAHQQAV